MTCIVWVVANRKVFIWWDTQGTDNDYSKDIRKDVKVFKNGDFVIWFSGSYRVGQILRYCLDFTMEPTESGKIEKDFMWYMCCDFVTHIRDSLEKNFYSDTKKDKKVWEMSILIWYKDKLVQICEDFQVSECVNPFDSVWCWKEFAKWILFEKMMNWKLTWWDDSIWLQVKQTIEYVSKLSAWVWWNITLLTT